MRITLYIVCLLVILYVGCIEEIPIQTNSGEQYLVVNGVLNNLEENQVIRLEQTIAYGVPPLKVFDASIVLHENNTQTYIFSEGKAGEYVLEPSQFRAITGAIYYITITLPNGKIYESIPDTMLLGIRPNTMTWEVVDKAELSGEGVFINYSAVKLLINTSLPGKDVYLKWTTSSAFQFTTLPECNAFKNVYTCYYSNDINASELFIYSNELNQLPRLENFEIGYESIYPDYKFFETHYYSVYQHRISARAFEYYRQLRLVSNQNGSIFDAVPASVKGNVFNTSDADEKVLGFFQVSSVEIIRERIVESDFAGKYSLLKKLGNFCAWFFGSGTYEPACCSCGELDEPLIDKPIWW